MGFIDDILADDSAALVDSDFMPEVESVVYTFATGVKRTIPVQVFREPAAKVPGTQSMTAPTLRVFIRRHATEGVTAIDRNGTEFITIAEKKGGTAKKIPVTNIESEDAGGFVVRLT